VTDAESPEPPDPRIGNVLQGRYRVLSRIASGAMGVVYRGERVQLGRPVAVKFLHPWIAAQKAFLSRFENEARAMSRLLHPNCVSVIDFGVEGAPFLVMDFVTGRTLRELMLGGRLQISRALRIAQQLLAGLAHAHAQGIVHRDLKPENLILSDEEGLEEHLRILDFGLAKLRDGPAMTAGMAVGTPSYMSPEQSGADGAIDARTDLYAVGIVMFEMLAGRKPFQSENVGELILMQRESPPPLLRQVASGAGISAELEALVMRAMSKLSVDRFQSASEMSEAINATPEGRAIARPPADKREERRAPVPSTKTTVDTVSAVRRRLEEHDPSAAKALAAVERRGPPPGAPRPEAPRGAPVSQWRALSLGLGIVGLVTAALLVGRALRHHGSEPAEASAALTASPSAPVAMGAVVPPTAARPAQAPAAAAPPPSPPSPATAQGLEEARQLIARHDTEGAMAVLGRLRAAEPENADVLYLQALVEFDARRWTEGVAAAQLAVKKDPALKSDADLINGVIRSLVSDHGYQRSQQFLRAAGEPAMPFIREAARKDPSPKVRERAGELLAGGGRGGGRGWATRSSSSGSSLFKR
jgi:serine/threonine-protein kinase